MLLTALEENNSFISCAVSKTGLTRGWRPRPGPLTFKPKTSLYKSARRRCHRQDRCVVTCHCTQSAGLPLHAALISSDLPLPRRESDTTGDLDKHVT